MKTNILLKFSLTLVSAAVLAACSSGGGGHHDDSAAKAKQQQEIAKKAKEDEKKAEEEKKLAAEAEKKVKETSEVGHKFVQKVNSNLNVGTGTATNSHASTQATAMRLELDPSLDTIVVAVPLDKEGKASTTAPQAYLEDFDFRKDQAELAADNKEGLTELRHVYIGQNTKNGADRPGVNSDNLTKTATQGKDTGVAVVYEEGRLNYTDYTGNDVTDPKEKRTQEYLKTVDGGKGSLAEVYGYRTFAVGDSSKGENVEEANLNNAPFTRLVNEKEQSYADGQLNYVQYGRVTSNLHQAQMEQFKDGKKLGDYGTKVVGFGQYGSNGTENHYFYRGIGDTKYSETLAADLGKHYGQTDGKLQYQGHAVTYGIDHKFASTDGIPNAIGYKQELVSGTHVAAEINLADKSVTGNLYDVWRHGNRTDKGFEVKQVELASFQGKLENNGSIAGSSVRKADGDKGTFNANLFGEHGEELGGAIKSQESLQDKQWGAVFGAEVQNRTPGVAPTPTQVPAWGESTDQQDTNSPIR